MSLIRQVWLLLLFTLASVFVAAVGVSLHSARQYLDTQLTVKNNDAAQALALTLSQQRGDPTAMELVLSGRPRWRLWTPPARETPPWPASPRGCCTRQRGTTRCWRRR